MGIHWIIIIGFWVTEAPTWKWPIDTRYGVSATFGEFRGDHFHMGIDFSTDGKEGMPIRPTRSGSVQKVRAQRHGYGRVVYVIHENGMTSVYGHLAGFGEKISAALNDRGIKAGEFFGTVQLSVSLSSEDILGYSGESGAGLPHFHFEIRDQKNAPMDPLSLPFPALAKDFQMKFEGVRLLPLSNDARINHGRVPVFLPKGQLSCQARGDVGIEVVAHLETSRGNRLGIAGVRLFRAGQKCGQWKPEKIPYPQYRRAGTVFDQARGGFSPTRYVYGFDQRHEILGPVDGFEPMDPLLVSEITRIEVDLRDMSGQWHTEILDLDPDANRRELNDLGTFSAVQSTTLELTPWRDVLRVRGLVAGTLILPDQMVGFSRGQEAFFEVNASEQPQTWMWRTKNGAIKRTLCRLPHHGPFLFSCDEFELDFQGETLPGPQLALLLPPNIRLMSETLEYVSPVLQFSRDGLPVPKLVARFQTASPNAGFFAWSYNKDRWVFWGKSSEIKPGWVSAEIDYFTPLVVARDIAAPVILPKATHAFFEGTRQIIPVRDRGSGVDRDAISVRSKGRNVPFFYDRDRHWIVLQESQTDPVTVRVSDRTGLTTLRTL